MWALVFLVALLATTLGAIIGNGGGVIIKPVLDSLGIASVAEISFLSACTVLAMSAYSVGKGFIAKDNAVKLKTATPLAIGAAVGGVAGKVIFNYLKSISDNPDRVGAYQAVCLGIFSLGTLIYTLCKKNIKTLHISNVCICIAIGLGLGIISSFLGIGGGPINLVVLMFFFSMKTKEAAQNSLYIIFFTQTAAVITAAVTKTVPAGTDWLWLATMVIGGIGGGCVGRIIRKRVSAHTIDCLFAGMIIFIIGICIYNAAKLF